MPKTRPPYMLSIEDTHGHSFLEDFHLGTDPAIALDEVATRFHGRTKAGMPIVTTALKDSAGKLLAVYDGQWHNVAAEIQPIVRARA